MRPGRKPTPSVIRRQNGNPGKRSFNALEPVLPPGMPACPPHLGATAREEWDRLAGILHGHGVLTEADRATFAAYCQSWARWVEAEEKLKETPMLIRTPSGYVQQSPWLSIANRQLELMNRQAAELGLTPASRTRVRALETISEPTINKIERVIVRIGTNDANATSDGCPVWVRHEN
jgi:P27 family predicted phage terminase small subunit